MTTFFRSLLAILLLTIGMAANAQSFQNTAGTPQNDTYWGGVTIANGYVAVGTTQNNLGGNDLLLTQYNLNGTIAWSRLINIPSSTTTGISRLEPRDIAAIPADAPTSPLSVAGGYYITGYEVGPTPNFPGNMFVLCTDNAGNVLWFRTNIVPTLNIQQSEGVSVVVQPDGGVIAVGNAQLAASTPGTAGPNWIIATRFSAAGALAWSRIYGTPTPAGSTTSPTYTAHEATYNQVGCTGTTIAGGAVLVGEVANEQLFTTASGGAPGPHLLAMSIDGAGNECWRAAYPAYQTSPNAIGQSSVGYDITYSPSLTNYILVGKAQSAATALPTAYGVRINTNGTLVCSSLMNLPNSSGTLSNWFARGVTTSYTAGRVVMVGPNVSTNRTYAAEINVSTCPFTLIWQKEYPLSTANVVPVAGISGNGIPENITQAASNSATTSGGYFITTNVFSNIPPLSDTHVIRTGLAGAVLANCPAIDGQFAVIQSGMRIELTPNSIDDASWNSLAPTSTALTLVSTICNEQAACAVNASFTTNISGNIATFVNTSTGNGTLSYTWSFGDGTGSTDTNPTHTYASPGTYNVCLTATNTMPDGTSCSQTVCQTIIINPPTTCTATPNFCVTLNNNIATFANSSTGNGTLSYLWEFGDGTTSTAANPSKSYPSAGGNFTVCLTVTTTLPDGTKCCQKCCKTITINPTCTASANFRFTVNGTSVSFSNTSATGQTYLWTFGNGNTSTSYTPPTQNYAPGTYQVCLEATRTNTIGNCSKTVCKTIVIDPPCNLIARFRPTLCLNSNTVIFNNFTITNTTGTTATYLWEFGDGNSSNAQSPSHTYTTAGTYTVCLTVSMNNNTCRSRVCQVIKVEPSICNNNCVPSNMIAPNDEGYQEAPANKALNEGSDLQIVPNPADEMIWISLPEKVGEGQLIEVFDMQGKLVASTQAANPATATELSVHELAKGMYFVKVTDDSGQIHTSKLIKE